MNKELQFIERQIAETREVRDDALRVAQEASHKLLELGSERNRILGKLASRHLYAVADVVEVPNSRLEVNRQPPDGAA